MEQVGALKCGFLPVLNISSIMTGCYISNGIQYLISDFATHCNHSHEISVLKPALLHGIKRFPRHIL